HASWRQLPEFLEAESVGLRFAVAIQREVRDELLRHRAAAAFGEYGDARADVDARRVVRAVAAVLLDAHVGAAHAHDALVLDQRACSRKAGEYVHAQRLGARGELSAQAAERNDVVATILLLRRCRQAEAPLAG